MKAWSVFEETTAALVNPDDPVLVDTGVRVKSFPELDRILPDLPGRRFRILPTAGGGIGCTKDWERSGKCHED